nr:SUMO-activating enzyme subunit 1 [Podarcis muralis]
MVEKEEKDEAGRASAAAAPGAGGPAPRADSAAAISEEEAAQYDRQIRLWGLEAQKRLRASRVLLVGMKGLGAEVAKNLILAGVKALTMLDHQQVSPEDTQAQFLIAGGSLGKNRAEASLERAQDLNPMVDVKADPGNVEQKPEEFFTRFDVVCVTCCSQEVLVKIDQICHKNGIKFFAGDVFGYHGYMFANLGEHEFVEEKTKVAKAGQGVEDGPDAKKAKLDFTETTLVKKCVNFCLLKEALTVDWSGEKAKAALKRTAPDYFLLQVLLRFRTLKGRDPSLQSCSEDAEVLLQMRTDVLASLGVAADLLPDDFASSCCSEVAPVCAVVGGVLGQEVVKALSQRDAPLNNFFFFDGMRGNGMVECLTPN